jgi:hypothetical protein
MAANGNETIFTMEATPLKYGPGSSEEVGWEIKRMGVSRVMLVSDPGIVKADITPHIQELIEAEGIEVEVWDRSRVRADGGLLPGGGGLRKGGKLRRVRGGRRRVEHRHGEGLGPDRDPGGEIMEYVNPPLGGKKPPSPLKPLSRPTTGGTAPRRHVRILDIPTQRLKTGSSHPTCAARGVVDPCSRGACRRVTSSAA